MKKKIKLTGLILVILIFVLTLSGYIYESISYQNVTRNYPPDGYMIDVGERLIHVNMEGEKTNLPPVVIETGTGNWSYDWSQFQAELSKHTQVLTYDRAGYGWSDPPNNGFSLDSTVLDLKTVLDKVEINTPVILIGHSVGGVYARHFNEHYPEMVAGLILVDSRNEFFKDAAPAYNKEFFRAEDQTLNKLLSRLGIIRLVGENTLAGMPDFISKEKYAQVQYDAPFFNVLDEEIKNIPANVEMLKQIQPLQNKPLTVITPEEVDTYADTLGFSNQEAMDINQKWMDSQKQLTELSSNSEFIIVPKSGHAVMYDQPQIILDSMLQMGINWVENMKN